MKYFASFFLLAALFLLPNYASAQVTGVKLAPSIIEERANPGDTLSLTLRLTNLDSQERKFFLVKRDISGLSPEGYPIFASAGEKTGYELSEWITLPEELTLQGNSTVEIPFKISVPAGASPGGHFAGVFVSYEPPRPELTGAGVGFEVASVINLRVSGTIFEEAEIREFRTDKAVYGTAEVKFFARVENIGNVLVRPRGPIDIVDMFGRKRATVRMNESAAAIFPKSVREFEVLWSEKRILFGRYQANLALVYGEDSRKTISASASFWIVPFHIILPILFGILALTLGSAWMIKLYVRKKISQILGSSELSRPQAGKNLEVLQQKVLEKRMLQYRRGLAPPKIVTVIVALLIFTILFLIILFLLFA